MTDRNSVLREAWQKINDMIIPGPLGGNGCDRLAQRNGVILAANAILALMQEGVDAGAQQDKPSAVCAPSLSREQAGMREALEMSEAERIGRMILQAADDMRAANYGIPRVTEIVGDFVTALSSFTEGK